MRMREDVITRHQHTDSCSNAAQNVSWHHIIYYM